MRIVIIGAAGQLGRELTSCLGEQTLFSPTHAELDVTNPSLITSYLTKTKPDVVINTSAFHDVAMCQQKPDKAFEVNEQAPGELARVCDNIGARFFHISTDYVFSGNKGRPYREDDNPSPLMVYGASKLAGERLAISNCIDTYIIRTTGLFGKHPCRAKPDGLNFVKTMLQKARNGEEVKVVRDQQCCPTYARDLAFQIGLMAKSDITPGIYHAVTPPGMSWSNFARLIFQIADVDVNIVEVNSDEFPYSFKRPPDSRLENAALKSAGIFNMPEIDEAIANFITKLNIMF